MECNICPRKCNVNRDISTGYCKMTSQIKVARAALHMWEEPCISGEKGSGTVFFSGCNMGCVYCQNKEISHLGFGKTVTVFQLADIFLNLQSQGALNINLVTPTHYAPQIIQSVAVAKIKGLNVPIVYNTSGYENPQDINKLKNTVDIFLPDFKYFYSNIANKYSYAKNYPQIAKQAIEQMVKQQPKCVFNESGIMQKGVIVRVLVLPGQIQNAKDIIEYLYNKYNNKIFISIMSQYTPCTNLLNFPEINRKVTQEEYDEVVNFACDIGVENGFIQEGEAASESFIPPFNLEGV